MFLPAHLSRSPRRLGAFALLLIALFTCVASGELPLAERMVGLWHDQEGEGMYVRLKKDGTFAAYRSKPSADAKAEMNGTWSVKADGQAEMIVQGQDQTHEVTGKVSFEGEELVFTNAEGKVSRHRREEAALAP